MEHTKKEWIAIPCNGLSGWRICIEDGKHQICGITPSVSASGLLTKEQHLANARLMAAAPDLLAALKACESLLRGTGPESHLYAQVKAAIAKAEGTTNTAENNERKFTDAVFSAVKRFKGQKGQGNPCE